VVARKQPR